ncbi:ATP-binding protein [Nocardioides sp. AN3]
MIRDRLGRLPLRTRLVAGFVVAMLVLLSLAGVVVYWRVQYALDRGLDSELANAAAAIQPLVGPAGDVNSPSADATGAGWQVLSSGGDVLDAGGPAPDHRLLQASRLPTSGAKTYDVGSILEDDRTPYRVRVSRLPQSRFLLVAVRRDHRDEALRELVAQLVLAGLGSLAVAAVVGNQLARAALRPVERYRSRAAEIAVGTTSDLRLDVPEGRDDEVTRLGHTLNEMLGALEASMVRERRFVNDASHELRTPLTLLKSRIQLARRRTRSVEEHERVLDELAVDLDRLTELAQHLLELGTPTGPGSADAIAVAEAVVEREHAAHPERRLTASTPDAAAGAARVALPERAVDRIVTNLVSNAFTHGRAPVEVAIRLAGHHVVITVTDAGPGMSADMLASAPRRFTRSPEARSRPGSGLGLSLVEELVTAAGGQLRLCHAGEHVAHGNAIMVACEHGAGMTASVLLPLAS